MLAGVRDALLALPAHCAVGRAAVVDWFAETDESLQGMFPMARTGRVSRRSPDVSRRNGQMTRRNVIRCFLGAAAWLAAGRRRTSRAQTALAAREVWARIEAVGDGVWAVVSTPSPDDRTSYATFCNGGIIAGRERVLVFEGFGSADGGAWVAEQA